MSTLVSITVPNDSVSVAHRIHTLPVVVIFPHNQCNCRCVMCDIWRIRQAKQLDPADLEPHLESFRKLGVRWVVFSGGEPQINEKWRFLAQMFRSIGCRVTLLTAGLLLQSQAKEVVDSVDDVIVSLDGPQALHNKIRRVANAFEQIAHGVEALRQLDPRIEIRSRCTVQKANHTSLRATVTAAKELGLMSISFLAADLTSSAFNHAEAKRPDHADRVALTPNEIDALTIEIERLIHEHESDLKSGFVVESPQKLRCIVHHFRAHQQQKEPTAPRCNAPWVSTVIEASGDVRPCFFHPVLGNIHKNLLADILNGPAALQFRATLDVPNNPICRNCVCSLYIPQ